MAVPAWLINPLVRIPLQEKYAEDLKQDVKMKALIGYEEQIEGTSNYVVGATFLPSHAPLQLVR